MVDWMVEKMAIGKAVLKDIVKGVTTAAYMAVEWVEKLADS